jgi:dienelactone hydrolase
MNIEHFRSIVVSVSFGCLASSSALAQPVITTQPANQFLTPGTSATFSVLTTGAAPITYQWLFDGTAMSIATSRTLSLADPQPSQWGYYSVIISNASGSVTSQVAELKVFVSAPHNMGGIEAEPDGSMNLSFGGETTAAFGPYYDLYPLECSSDLLNWAPLVTLQRSNTALDTQGFVDTNAPALGQRFYRTPTNQLATPDPAPTGPYPVGTFSMLMIDPSRANAAGKTNYQFMTTFWYPTVPAAGVLPAKYVEPQVALGESFWNLSTLGVSGAGNFGREVVAFFSHSLSNAPLATYLAKYPVILYSPGTYGHRREITDKAEDLASWGYVVVGLDASDTYVSVFPDGRVVYGGSVGSDQDRVQDMQFVLGQLAILNAGDPRLNGRLDLDRIGAMGWSWGGGITEELCLRDPRCKAGVGFEPANWVAVTNLLTQPLKVPYLFFRGDFGPDPDPSWTPDGFADERLEAFDEQNTNAYYVKLASTVHGSFADPDLIDDPASIVSWLGTPMSGQFLAPARVSQIVRTYLLSFFNKFLKGEDDHLLDGPSPAYPEVIQFLSAASSSLPPEYPSAGLAWIFA